MARILFIRGGAVGDFVLTLPAMRLVCDTLPEVEIEILGYDAITQLATATGIAAETRSIEHGPLAHFFVPGGELDAELTKYFAGFSVVVSYLFDPDGIFRDNLLRAGVSHLVEASHRVDDSSADARPAAHQLAAPLEGLALYLDEPFVDLEFDEAAHQSADAVIGKINPHETLIALHPGSGSPRKNWPRKNWIDVVSRLHGEHPHSRFLIVSGEAEAESIGDFLLQLEAESLPCRQARELPLPALGAALSRCALFLGHDSGTSHLAAACGLPCVLLFGPTRAEIWAPQNPEVRVVASHDEKLSTIQVDEVLKNVAEVL